MKRILVSADPFEARAALLDGDRLINVEFESASAEKLKGTVYRGRVTAIEPSLGAAFVDYGAAKDGFLPLDEVCERSLCELSGRKGAHPALRQGDHVLVQVSREPFGKKGATLTMHISLPGRFVVLTPFSDRTGISRRLQDTERARLKEVVSQLRVPENCGIIVRTVGESEPVSELQADLDMLARTWEEIRRKFRAASGVQEVHSEACLAVRFVRDYMTRDVKEVLVEDEPSYRELLRYMEQHMPQSRDMVRRYEGELPLFARYGVERQIETLWDERVPLPSGGSIVFGQTEALVAIDVNSGRLKQKDEESTAFKTNMEAAREIARQVVLRDLGGIMVVDFIDMEDQANRRAVEEELKKALAMDKARLTFGKIGDFGLLAFSRQRLRQSAESSAMVECPTCSGTGRVRSPALLAMSALRKVRELLARQRPGQRVAFVEVKAPVEVANFLNNRKRAALAECEERFDVLIDVVGDPQAAMTGVRISALPEVPPDRAALRGYDQNTQAPEPEPEPGLIGGLLRRLLGLGKENGSEANNGPGDAALDVAGAKPAPGPAARKAARPRAKSVAKGPTGAAEPPPAGSADGSDSDKEQPKKRRHRGGRGRRRREGGQGDVATSGEG